MKLENFQKQVDVLPSKNQALQDANLLWLLMIK